MAAHWFRSLVAVACLLALATAYGQDRSQYVPLSPTLSERMGQLRNNLFGGQQENGARADTRAAGVRVSRPANSNIEKNAAPTRPSQTAASARHGGPLRSYSGTAAMTGRAALNNANGRPRDRVVSSEEIDHENVPTLPRRSLFGRATDTTSPFGGAGSALLPSSPPSMSQRLGIARQPTDVDPFTDEPQEADGYGSHSFRGSTSNKVQQIINPTVAGAANAVDHALPSLARSPRSPFPSSEGPGERRPAVSGPVVTPATQPAVSAPVASSRRGFSAASPSDRIASALPDRNPAAAAGSDADLLFKRQSPLISVETSGPRTMIIGKEGTYIVTVQNAGDVAANEVAVTIRIPDWADVVGSKETSGVAQIPTTAPADLNASPVVANGSMHAVKWSLPRLEAKSKEQLSLQIVPRQSRPFDLAVQWTFTPITQSTVVQVQEPKLVMNLSGPADVLFGETKIYKMTLSNPGTGDAENVVIHLSPLTGQPGAPTKHHIGTIKAGDSKVIEVELTARHAGQVVIHAAATADAGLQAEVSEQVIVRRAALEIKIAGSKARYAGTVAAYQIEVHNPGNAPAEDVQVVATLPAGAKFVATTFGGQASPDGAKVQWTVPSIRAGGDAVLELKCLVHNPGVNRLAVHSTAPGELSATAEDVAQVEALADLKLDVIDPKGPIAVGMDVTYEIRVLNRGTKHASDVKVIGYFSGKIEPVGANGGEHRLVPGIVVFKPIASLAPGGEAAFKITAVAKAPGNHMFKAEVVCESAGAKLGSEHTTLFYGDEIGGDSGNVDHAAEDSSRPLVPKAVFETDESSTSATSDFDSSEPAAALQDESAPPFRNPSSPALPNQRTPTAIGQPATGQPNEPVSTLEQQSSPGWQKQAAPAFQNQPTPMLQRTSTPQPGSAYLPAGRPARTATPVIPVSPFALRPSTKK